MEQVHEISRDEKLREVAREIAYRRNVYGKMVRDGRMKQETADYRIRMMLAIAKDYGGHGDEAK